MPVSHQFCRPDGEAEFRNKVDTELREALGLPADEHNYSMQFEILTNIGIATAKGPRGNVTKEACDEYFAKDSGCTELEIRVYTDFLCGRYTFYAWRGGPGSL